MPVMLAKPAPPTEDKRWRIIETTMRRNGHQPHALIEALHSIQDTFGFLDEASMKFVAESLRVPLSKVYGVATFYHYFSLKPQGKHTCIVCMGTACYIKGGGQLVEEVSRTYDIKPGETTDDGELSLLTARCIGSCSLAPAVVLDGVVTPRMNKASLKDKLAELKR